MLTLSASASTTGMNRARATASLELALEDADQERRQDAAGNVAQEPGKAAAEGDERG